MARDNYSYKKYMREQLKKKKKEEKLQRKLAKKSGHGAETETRKPGDTANAAAAGTGPGGV